MTKTYTKNIAEYLADLSYEDIPKDVVNKAKQCILDFIGYSIVSVDDEPARLLFELVKKLGGREESTIMGFRHETSCAYAALVNAAMAHMCELDDTHRATMSHNGDSVIPAALAVAEREKADGKKLITAVVTGYEAAIRVGDAVCPSHYAKGWHTSGTINHFGAAAAAGKILGLNADKMENALGLAGVQAAGIFASDASWPPPEKGEAMTKDFRVGKSSMNGVLSALLAEMGYTGPVNVLEDKKGFCRLYSDVYNLKKLTEGLCEKFKIMEVAHKPYSSCRYTHAAIDGTLEIAQRYGVSKDNLSKITVKGHSYTMWMDLPEASGPYGPRNSMQFQLALTMAEGKAGLMKVMRDPTGYPQEKLKDPVIRNLMQKVIMVHDKDLEKDWPGWSTIVEVETIYGKKYSRRVDYPKGEPENPMTTEELHEKFRILASKVLNKGNVEKIIKKVEALDEVRDTTELCALLSP